MKLLVYMPMTHERISAKTFKSFTEMTNNGIPPEFEVNILIHDLFPLDRNRNDAVTQALSSKYDADYIFFADGDQVFPHDAIPKLLAHCTDEFPVVSGVYWRKAPPHTCVQGHYSPWTKDLENRRPTIEKLGFIDKDGNQCMFYRSLMDYTTVQPIDVAGMGCLLVRTDVFKKLDLPYFAYFNPYSLGGDYTIQHLSEEMLFFCKLRKAGIKTLVVPEVRCGHVTEKVIGCPEQ